jgi:RNA polymerase sigma-70 factor (ECF subfamily)
MGRSKDFDELYRAHFDEVCNLVRHNGVPAADAEDVAQEAFLKFDRLRERYPQAPPVPLLCSIAKNTARDFRKTDPGRKPIPIVEAAPPVTPEEQIRQSEGQAVFSRIVRELPEELRTVYVMADLQEIPHAKIADDLKIPLGTVKSRLSTARAAIEAILKQLARTNQLPAVLLPLVLGMSRKPAWLEKLSDLTRPTRIGLGVILPILIPLAYLPLNAVPIMPEPPQNSANAGVTALGKNAGTGTAREGKPAPVDPQCSPGATRTGREEDRAPIGPPSSPAAHTAPAALEAHATAEAAAIAGSKPPPGHAKQSFQGQDRDQRDREMMLIQNARLAWSIRDGKRALAELYRHKALHPDGYMSHERDDLIALIEHEAARR